MLGQPSTIYAIKYLIPHDLNCDLKINGEKVDHLFINNVPDVLSWGNYHSENLTDPRRYKRRTLTITVHAGDDNYQEILNDLALAIASARLSEQELEIWRLAAFGEQPCPQEDREIIARALKRGISASGEDWVNRDVRSIYIFTSDE